MYVTVSVGAQLMGSVGQGRIGQGRVGLGSPPWVAPPLWRGLGEYRRVV